MTKNIRPETTHSIASVVARIFVYLAFVASGLLGFFVYWSVDTSPNAPGAGWMVMCLAPFWCGLCLLAVVSGYKLGGAWRVIGWLPFLSGLLGSLMINNLV